MTLPTLGPTDNALTVFADLGSGFENGASQIGAIVAAMGTIDDPQGELALFRSIFQNIQTDMNAISAPLIAGVPSDSTPYSNLALDLTTLAGDFPLIAGGGDYVAASYSLTAAAGLLNDAASLVNQGLSKSGDAADLERTQFIGDLLGVGIDFGVFGSGASVPEPGTFSLVGIALGALCVFRRLRKPASAEVGIGAGNP